MPPATLPSLSGQPSPPTDSGATGSAAPAPPFAPPGPAWDAADLMTLQMLRGSLARARAGLVSADRATCRQAQAELMRLLGYLAGFLDGRGIAAAARPHEGFLQMASLAAPEAPDAALDRIDAALAALLDLRPTRGPRLDRAGAAARAALVQLAAELSEAIVVSLSSGMP